MEATPRKQHTALDALLQNTYYHKPPFEPADRTKIFDFWRLFYTAFSRPQNILGLIAQEETNKSGSMKIPRKEFHGIYSALPSWRSSSFDISKIELETMKQSNLKHEYSFTSHVLLYENCPLQYKFFKELEFTSVRQSGPMAGTLIHQTIEDIHKAVLRGEESSITNDNISNWFEANYRSLSQAERTYLGEGQRTALLNQVLRYKARQENDWSRIRDAEVDVSLVKDEYILKGTIDLIQGEGDTVELVDFKSGKKPDVNAPADRELLNRYKRQLEVYAHLVEERTGNVVSRMHLYYTAEKDGIPTVSYDRDKANVAETIRSFDEVVGKIEKKNYDMAGTVKCERLCGNCDMKFYCNPEFLTFRG